MAVVAIPVARTSGGEVSLPNAYVAALVGVGACPVLIPAVPGVVERLDEYLDGVDAVLLPGGGDIDPSRYCEEPRTTLDQLDPVRDELELALLDWSMTTGTRALGVCRGAQLMGVHSGGELIQDLPSAGFPGHLDTRVDAHYAALEHGIDVSGDSLLGTLLAEVTKVNSHHHQALRSVGPGLRPVAWSPDGVIEAIEGHSWLGVQWHPELLHEEQQRSIFTWLAHGDVRSEVRV